MSNYYDTVKEKIADYITKEPVVETDEIISAYTLFSILKEENKKFRHVAENEKALLDELNSIYPVEVKYVKNGLFKKKTKHDYFNHISHAIGRESAEISLSTYSRAVGYITLNKDYDYDGIYSKLNSLTEEAYNQCGGYIESIFSELERIGKLYAFDSHPYSKIEHEGFTVIANLHDCGGILFNYQINLNKNFDPNNSSDIYYYYGKENNIKKTVEDNMEAILKNTPIIINDLSYTFYALVMNYKMNEDKKKIEKEIDEAFQKLYEKK